MDKQLLAHYSAPQRDPVFIKRQPVATTKRANAALVVYGLLLGVAVSGCAAVLITHLIQ